MSNPTWGQSVLRVCTKKSDLPTERVNENLEEESWVYGDDTRLACPQLSISARMLAFEGPIRIVPAWEIVDAVVTASGLLLYLPKTRR